MAVQASGFWTSQADRKEAHRPQGERRKKEGGMGGQEVPRNPLVAFTH